VVMVVTRVDPGPPRFPLWDASEQQTEFALAAPLSLGTACEGRPLGYGGCGGAVVRWVLDGSC
jgi:hypothetical protein